MCNISTVDHLGPRWLPLLFVALTPLAGSLTACHHPAEAPAGLPLVVTQQVHTPLLANGMATLRYPVETAARYSTVMSFRVGGQIVERNVRLGDQVHPGEVLARLDPTDATRQVAAARAAFAAADHRLLFARQQHERDTAQFAAELIARSALEQTEDAWHAAQAGRDQAEANWVVARNALHHHSLIADHAGVITAESADTGQVVAAGQAVYGLAWSGDLDATLDAPAADVARLTVGTPATIAFPALPGRHFDARIREVAPAADPQSRTYRVKLTLSDRDSAVRIGMSGEAVLAAAPLTAAATASPNNAQFRIPAPALFHRGDTPAVWIVHTADSTLELRPVEVHAYDERHAVVSGLADGERLVTAGVHTVFAGERIQAIDPPAADDTDGSPQPVAMR